MLRYAPIATAEIKNTCPLGNMLNKARSVNFKIEIGILRYSIPSFNLHFLLTLNIK